jgi:hypothetical protein
MTQVYFDIYFQVEMVCFIFYKQPIESFCLMSNRVLVLDYYKQDNITFCVPGRKYYVKEGPRPRKKSDFKKLMMVIKRGCGLD